MIDEGYILRLFNAARDSDDLCRLRNTVALDVAAEDKGELRRLFVTVLRNVVIREVRRRRGCVLCGTVLIHPYMCDECHLYQGR